MFCLFRNCAFLILTIRPVFAPLADEKVFNDYHLDYETLTWLDGEVDVAPEFVYENSENLVDAL